VEKIKKTLKNVKKRDLNKNVKNVYYMILWFATSFVSSEICKSGDSFERGYIAVRVSETVRCINYF